ncbi:MAG: DUF1552 domain-containing protein [Polyangia bacterium]
MDRRTVLKGVLATGATVSIPLPLMEIMLNGNGTAYAQTAAPVPPLFVLWFFGNGSLPGVWKPANTGTGSNWALSSQLQPLSALKSYLTVISGLTNQLVVGGAEHPTGSAGATTGAPLNGNAVTAASVDQIIANVIGTGAPFKSIEVGVTPATPNGPQDSLATVSHKGPNAKNVPDYDPKSIFTRLFMGGGNNTTGSGGAGGMGGGSGISQATKLANVRKSVLDSVLNDGTALQKKLGSADKQRLQQHLDSIRAIEMRLMTSSSSTGTGGMGGGSGTITIPSVCASPTAPTAGKDTNSEAPPATNSAMCDLAMLALACDKTRVLSFVFSLPAAHVYYRHLGSNMNADFHDTICHGDPGDQSSQPRVDTGVHYAMTCLNEFLTKMQATSHGASNLLDQSLVLVTSDTAWGKIHTNTEWPVLLAGKAGGKLQGDGHYNFPGGNLSKALFTAAQIMGSTATSFGGGAGAVTSPLTGIGIKS